MVSPISIQGFTGVGSPDAKVGHGYGSVKDGPLTRTRSAPAGYPYNLDDDYDEECDEEDYYDESDEELAVKVSKHLSGDPASAHVADRRSFMSSDTFGISNGPIGAYAESVNRVDELSATIRQRPRSSEPDSGTIYGWSSQPMWDEPPRKASSKMYRYEDITDDDEEKEFEELQRRHYETRLRKFVRGVLRENVAQFDRKRLTRDKLLYGAE